ncbi:MAG: PepSY domain-containing protein [Oscillospiraceae bacterium]|nr:PepSY domain-containing protein [Oscillospiraceae bacterium]
MKLLAIVLSLLLLTGCGAALAQIEKTEERIETAADRLEETVEANMTPTAAQADLITEQEAQQIALEHAGFTADQVTQLRVSYEIDDGVPEYEVDFRVDRMEYEYTIHAETGDILSYDMDD